MKRNVTMEEISDGKLYGLNDMVKVGCNDCEGCSACCHGMGSSIVLDPFDIYRLTTGLHTSFEKLLEKYIELNVFDGIIMPNLKLSGSGEACGFLNENGRCSIHVHRPGICRLFPLGRVYENHSFRYFLQVNECQKPNKTKVKVKKWIDTPGIADNEKYIVDWHYFLEDIQNKMAENNDDTFNKKINMYLLQNFYIMPYEADNFYEQFYQRLKKAEEICK